MVKSAKIFWMSDIHYCHDENNKIDSINNKVKNSNRKKGIEIYFDSIRDRIKDAKPTHIVITGDLAFSGEYNQYKGMYERLLRDYFESEDGKEARLIICCGNHSCNRSIIHDTSFNSEFLKALEGKDLNKYSDKLSVLNELEKIELDIIRFTNVAKQSVNHGSKLLGKLTNSNTTPNLKASELLFLGYRDFYHDFVQPRFESINIRDKDFQKIVQFDIDSNQGLYGVIHDREYNIIFTVLNSAWMAWGNETYEKLFENLKTSSEFNEYGNLTYKIDILGRIKKILTEDLKSQLEFNNYICLSHHPFSWMSYEDNYVHNSLNEILELHDILLTGHVHVQHSWPTLYKGKTYWLEAPQIFDYHLYDNQVETSSDHYNYIPKNHGFSTFDLSPDLQFWEWSPYSLSSSDENGSSFHPFDIGAELNWKHLLKYKKKFEIKNLKKTIPSVTDLIGNDMSAVKWNEYIDYCKYNAKANGASKGSGEYLRIKNSEYYISLDSYLKNLPIYPSLKGLRYRDSIDEKPYNESFKLMFDNDKSVIYILPAFNFNHDYNQLIDFITEILSQNSHTVKIIHVLFFDFQLIEYFCTDLGTNDIAYINRCIASWFDRIKVAVVKKCDKINISGIAFDEKVIVLPQYIKHICS